MPFYEDKKRKTYYAKFSYIDEFGKRKYILKRGFKRRKDAKAFEDDFFIALEEGEHVKGLPFSKLADEYLEHYKARRKVSSYKTAYNIFKNHLLPYFHNKDVYELKPIDIKRFQDKKMTEGFSPNYLEKFQNFLSAMLAYAQKYHNLERNVARMAGGFEAPKPKALDFWYVEEFNTFAAAIEDIKHLTFFTLLFYGGFRKGELRAICWNDIDFDNKSIDINKTDYNGNVTTPKTAGSIRRVDMPANCMNLLKQYLEHYKLTQIYKDDYVVFGEAYRSISDSTIDRWYEKYIKLSGIKHRIKLHGFRHSHASYLINLGAQPHIIAQRLGHSDVSLVLNVYGHLYPSTQKAIIDIIEKDMARED
ncbi:tyrosine-type recombinase/integrase [Macrococcus capreoli]|uniref:site-specific integrase n=1 Tax=Macrococcus capreoli TaxID=2982690 RepID=UPI003EE57CCF